MEKPHHLAAAFIAGFGVAKPGAEARMGRVSLRSKASGEIRRRQAAANICFEYGLYQVEQPSTSLAAHYANDWWETYEGALPLAAKALEAGTAGRDEWLTILLHIQAVWPRHPDFERDVNEQGARRGLPPVAGDFLERLRQAALKENRQVMAASRFAVLRRDERAERFLLNDKGFATFGDHEAGMVFPLTREVAVLMALGRVRPGEDYEQLPRVERIVNARGMRLLNDLAWDHAGIRCVISHPDDDPQLAGLTDHDRTFKMTPRRQRPYRHTREPRLLDWATATA
ncbi:hypothetical protein KDK95_20525 [Actinospica sp. MGRD01-02]|uniref:Uncharacterized protein n=1 Tax=Actinospica acidithermotolerans TaxID=2828514 RepID=A0A941EBX1_9ACTN|nr:hypothetical protein [Actinospica acidithermotolerans]MBR7828706.1 hypothetical protein [Actinospica acidithermotolerans]